MRNSEVFDNYAKIALQEGLISQGEDKTNPRYDSLEISDIELLYGIKPNGKDEKHIMEQAHPESVIVAPAHDKVNGLVENEIERQNVGAGIARKPTTGHFGNQIYVQAHENLLNEVIKTSFLLDKNNETELMVLSDACAERLTKTALPPLAIVGLVAGGVALFKWLTYMENNPESRGFATDLAYAKEQLTQVITDDYPQLASIIAPFVAKLEETGQLHEQCEVYRSEIKAALVQLAGSSSSEEKKKVFAGNVAKLISSGKEKEVIKTFDQLKNNLNGILKALPIIIDELTQASKRHGSDSWYESETVKTITDWWQKYVVDSDAEDAIKSLVNLSKSAPAVLGVSGGVISSLQELKTQAPTSELDLVDTIMPKTEDKNSPLANQQTLPSWA